MDAAFWILASVLLVSIVSFVGVLALFRNRWLHKRLFWLVSFSVGALLGDAFIHLLPEAFEQAGEATLPVSLSVLVGILVFFVLEKVVHWHHCHHSEEECENVHHVKVFGIMNLLGDGVHNAIDGLVIAGSFLVSIPLGIATTIAVVFHEIPQEISDFGVLLHAGFSSRSALFFNFLSALTAFVGAVLVIGLNNSIAGLETLLLGFTAGGFIYIAGVDLVPELHKERKLGHILAQFVFIVFGMLVMLALLALG
jgi:zinc and cadmium transporter